VDGTTRSERLPDPGVPAKDHQAARLSARQEERAYE
jgi:hypothetical protein